MLGCDFDRDYKAEGPEGQQFPLAHIFVRRGKKIHHSWTSELFFTKPDPGTDIRHVDFMWPVWSILASQRKAGARAGGRASTTPEARPGP